MMVVSFCIAHGALLPHIHPLLISIYGFEISDFMSVIAKNTELTAKLLKGSTFHHKVCSSITPHAMLT